MFFARGFQTVRVFARDIEFAKSRYYDDDKPYDARLIVFGVDLLHENVALMKGLTPIYLLEHILCASFPLYKSTLGDNAITHLNGRYLLQGLNNGSGNFCQKLLKICSTFKGFELIQNLIVTGRVMSETRELLANQRILHAIPYQLKAANVTLRAVALDTQGLQNEIINLLPIHPAVVKSKTQLAVFYSYEPHTINDAIHPGFRITFMITSGDEIISALETLRTFAPETVAGAHGIASAWIPSDSVNKILSFW
jgi:hypothetical protein